MTDSVSKGRGWIHYLSVFKVTSRQQIAGLLGTACLAFETIVSYLILCLFTYLPIILGGLFNYTFVLRYINLPVI